MKLLSIKNKIFQGLQRPVKQYLASNQAHFPVEIEYAGKNYEELFFEFLKKNITVAEQENGLLSELDSGAQPFAQQVMSIFYQNNCNQFPRALKKIAKKEDEFPLASSLLMDFYKEHIGTVDVVDDFGETAFSKVLKADIHRKTPLLFLANHGAKHCLLTSRLQDTLKIRYPDVYDSAEENTAKWRFLP